MFKTSKKKRIRIINKLSKIIIMNNILKTPTLLLIFASCIIGCKTNTENNNAQPHQTISLKEHFKNSFYIGAAINENQILEKDSLAMNVLKSEFNTITPENEMKWERIHPQKDTFHFDISDKYVNLGIKNNLHIVGYALVWHSQLAAYMQNVKDSSTMANYVENHINTIVGRYKGKINYNEDETIIPIEPYIK